VGHEIDFTIADFVADVRAPTPSQAAELAVPNKADFDARLGAFAAHLERCARRKLADEARRVQVLEHRLGRAHPGVALRASQQRLDELEGRLVRAERQIAANLRQRLAEVASRIRHASPKIRVAAAADRIHHAGRRLEAGVRTVLERLHVRASLAERGLNSLSPLATLDRGYAIVCRRDTGSLVTDSGAVAAGDEIDVRLARGRLAATVDTTRSDD
jgi:exodeoxyribonuclease VII large subunit